MTGDLTQEEIGVLAPYVTNIDRPIYALKNLPEEVVAVLFAYYSRSRESLRSNLLKLVQERDVDLDTQLRRSSLRQEILPQPRRKPGNFMRNGSWATGTPR